MALIDQLDNLVIGPKSFSGGRNVEWSQSMSLEPGGGGVLPNQLIVLENLDVNTTGSLIGRKGTSRVNSSPINSGNRIRSLYFYTKATTGTKYVMVQTGTSVGHINLTTGIWTSVGTGLTTTSLKWITWNDNAYAFNGTGVYKFDGTTWSQVQDSDADTPDSVDGAVLDSVLFTAWDGTGLKSRVPYSNEFDAEAWGATNFRRIRERDGQDIIGIDVIGSRILCRRSKSTLWLHGSSIYSFAEEFLSEEIGQIGRMTNGKIEGGQLWQSNTGVVYFDTSTPKVFNEITRDTCQAEILGISRANRDAACGIYHPKTRRYLLSFPDEATPIIYVFFLSLPKLAEDGNLWFPHTTYIGVTVSAMAIDDEEGSAGKLYFGTTDGYVLEADSGYQDAGTDIVGKFKWGYTDCGIPNQVKNFQRVIVPARATSSIQVQLDVDFLKKTSTKSTSTYSASGNLIWDSGTWDNFNWASENVGSRKTRHLKMNGVRVAIQGQKTYSDITEIHPFMVEYFPKEKMRWP